MRVTRVIANLTVADSAAARDFYTHYLGLSVEDFNLGWVARYESPDGDAFVQLVTRDATASENAVISAAVGSYVDGDAAYKEAKRRGTRSFTRSSKKHGDRGCSLCARPTGPRPRVEQLSRCEVVRCVPASDERLVGGPVLPRTTSSVGRIVRRRRSRPLPRRSIALTSPFRCQPSLLLVWLGHSCEWRVGQRRRGTVVEADDRQTGGDGDAELVRSLEDAERDYVAHRQNRSRRRFGL